MKNIKVCIAIIKKNEKYLIQTRPKSGTRAGFWEFAGGKVEVGESFRQALIREIQEELGVSILAKEEIFAEKIKILHLRFFKCEILGNEEVSPKIGQTIKWATLEEMEKLKFLPADKNFLKFLFKKNS